jgi:hypothetical protein
MEIHFWVNPDKDKLLDDHLDLSYSNYLYYPSGYHYPMMLASPPFLMRPGQPYWPLGLPEKPESLEPRTLGRVLESHTGPDSPRIFAALRATSPLGPESLEGECTHLSSRAGLPLVPGRPLAAYPLPYLLARP